MRTLLDSLKDIRIPVGELQCRGHGERETLARRWLSKRTQPQVEDLLDPSKLLGDVVKWQNALAYLPLNIDSPLGTDRVPCLANLQGGSVVVVAEGEKDKFHYGTLTMLIGLAMRRSMKGVDHTQRRLAALNETVRSMFGEAGAVMTFQGSVDSIAVVGGDKINEIICAMDIAMEKGLITNQSPIYGAMTIIMEGHGFKVFSNILKIATKFNISMRETVRGLAVGGFASGQLARALNGLKMYERTKLDLMDRRNGSCVLDAAHFNPDSVSMENYRLLTVYTVGVLGNARNYPAINRTVTLTDLDQATKAAQAAKDYYKRLTARVQGETLAIRGHESSGACGYQDDDAFHH